MVDILLNEGIDISKYSSTEVKKANGKLKTLWNKDERRKEVENALQSPLAQALLKDIWETWHIHDRKDISHNFGNQEQTERKYIPVQFNPIMNLPICPTMAELPGAFQLAGSPFEEWILSMAIFERSCGSISIAATTEQYTKISRNDFPGRLLNRRFFRISADFVSRQPIALAIKAENQHGYMGMFDNIDQVVTHFRQTMNLK